MVWLPRTAPLPAVAVRTLVSETVAVMALKLPRGSLRAFTLVRRLCSWVLSCWSAEAWLLKVVSWVFHWVSCWLWD